MKYKISDKIHYYTNFNLYDVIEYNMHFLWFQSKEVNQCGSGKPTSFKIYKYKCMQTFIIYNVNFNSAKHLLIIIKALMQKAHWNFIAFSNIYEFKSISFWKS